MEEDVDVAKHDDVSVNEDDFIVVRELPESKLAVVVLVIRVFLSSRVSNPFDHSDLPPCCGECVAFGEGNGAVH